MSHDPAAADELLDRLLLDDDPTMTTVLQESAAAGLPPIAVSAQQGKFLTLLARAVGARRILEVGTLGGYSTIWLARGAGDGGAVVSLEYEPKHAEVARANLDRAGVGDRVEVIVGAAVETLPTLTGPFDLVFIDADKENNGTYLRWAVELGRPGTVIVVDNVIRDGRVLHDEPDAAAAGTLEALRLLGEDPRLDAAALQTVGAKGWDGFALAVVR
ncbi:O-methyltransferase [Mycobacterium sp. 1274756.6]|uniref:O-methyltransferase n=1 Tax=Mycobacterium sp. 1274756.6 TaxID=1834076 RepID=UPI0007FDC471|nr:O-methyltransferase [Mycobacterium sp. 1274756.6]OBJ73951.1 methyltransferase [Mycobacterium sp. 1274756.6]